MSLKDSLKKTKYLIHELDQVVYYFGEKKLSRLCYGETTAKPYDPFEYDRYINTFSWSIIFYSDKEGERYKNRLCEFYLNSQYSKDITSVELFLQSPLVPAEIKRIVLFNINEVGE